MTPAFSRLTAAALSHHAGWLSHALAADAIVGVTARAEACEALLRFHAMAAELEAAAGTDALAVSPIPPPAPKRDLAALFRLDHLPPHFPGGHTL